MKKQFKIPEISYIQACSTAETFVNLYYDRVDSKRHLIGKLYLDTAKMSWNGNMLEGEERLKNYAQSVS